MVCTFKRNGNFVHIQRTRVPEAPVVPVRYPAVVRFMVKTDLTGLYDFLQAIEAVLKGEAKMNLRQNLGAWLRSATLYMFKALFR